MDWADDPATEQQLLRLKQLGFVVTSPLTLTGAARLIRQYSKNASRPVASAVLPRAQTQTQVQSSPSVMKAPASAIKGPASATKAFTPQAPQQTAISESARMHAFKLRAALDNAKLALAANPNGPNVRADFTSRTSMRREFWLDTCRNPKEMMIGSVQVLEFYQNHGARFFSPTSEQIQEILDALDVAMPTWDKDHPELFYMTLEINFPNLLRRV
jgi:hypothetical protein